MKKLKVAIGLSGGVDSALSAYFLKKQGFEVTAVYLDCYRGSGFPCQADIDRAMAVKVAHFLHIPLKIIDLRSQYRRSVISYFFSEYKAGRTPNPDVICNRDIKFGIFYDLVINQWKFDYVATGHYARILEKKKEKFLAAGVDKNKDQSYFLYLLKKEQLAHILFPIGIMTKKEVREEAKRVKLPNFAKPDSQGICFIGAVNVKKFLLTKIKPKTGSVLDEKGNVIGKHDGVWFYTIGQRHGFKIDQKLVSRSKKQEVKPLFVLSKNVERNEIIVAPKEHLLIRKFIVGEWHSLVYSEKEKLVLKKTLKVRVRHLGALVSCTLKKVTKDKSEKNQSPSRAFYAVVLKKPVFGVAPGQSAVFYDGEIVLGGGIISDR